MALQQLQLVVCCLEWGNRGIAGLFVHTNAVKLKTPPPVSKGVLERVALYGINHCFSHFIVVIAIVGFKGTSPLVCGSALIQNHTG